MQTYPDQKGDAIIPMAIEANVWQAVEDLFMESPATRNLVKQRRVKVVGAVYDVGTGKINWLPEVNVAAILKTVESNPKRAKNAMAAKAH